jgi:hypothetical protein
MNVQTNQTFSSLDTPFLPQFFQLIKTGRALSDVGELSVRRLLREFQQDFTSWTGDALRIRKAFVHDPCQMCRAVLFPRHSARPSRSWSPSPSAMLPRAESPRSMIAVDENLCGIRLPALQRDIV